MMPCPDCRRTFGGEFAYSRHLDRRADRCRTWRELRRRGLHRDAEGIWRQAAPYGKAGQPRQMVLPGFKARTGSRTLESRRSAQRVRKTPSAPDSIPPQKAQGRLEGVAA